MAKKGLSFKGKQKTKGAVKAPTKRTMNFVHHKSQFDAKRMVPVILVLVVLIVAFAKFGILDPISQKVDALNELSAKREQVSALNAALVNYDKVAMEYGRYSYGWMTDQEINLVNRIHVLDLVEREIAPRASISDMAVHDNTLTMNIYGPTLKQASKMVDDLELDPLVESAYVYSAKAEDAEQAEIFLSINLVKEVQSDEEK